MSAASHRCEPGAEPAPCHEGGARVAPAPQLSEPHGPWSHTAPVLPPSGLASSPLEHGASQPAGAALGCPHRHTPHPPAPRSSRRRLHEGSGITEFFFFMPLTSSHLTFLFNQAWGHVFKAFPCLQTQTGSVHHISVPWHTRAGQQRATRCLPASPCASRVEQPTPGKRGRGRSAGLSRSPRSSAWAPGWQGGAAEGIAPGTRPERGQRGAGCAADDAPCVRRVCGWRCAQALEKEFPWPIGLEYGTGMVV